MDGRRAPRPDHHLRERGIGAAENLAAALIAGIVIAGIVIGALALVVSSSSVTPQIQRAWCLITSGTQCGGGGEAQTEEDGGRGGGLPAGQVPDPRDR